MDVDLPKPSSDVEKLDSAPIDMHRLVHFDLKGAPPKAKYYEEVFPVIASLGATGLLMEYEDMFPYNGELDDIAKKNAYSEQEVEQILESAKLNKLEVIPLIQSFGHFEFVLKHKKFQSLREVPEFPMTLCPLNTESLSLVCQMIDQIVAKHPQSKWIHIGADEVFHMGYCCMCHQHIQETNGEKTSMFLTFIKKILDYIHMKYPNLQVIMWDDMLREADLEVLQNSEIGNLVEPMVWSYHRSLMLPADLWDRYSKVFPCIWGASAFKGATGPCKFATDVGYHVQNNIEWLDAMKQESSKFEIFRGCCLTGWQRYDHYATLCEIFPAGFPSLALCLQTMTSGSFSLEAHQAASGILNFDTLIPLNPFKNSESETIPRCSFPGCNIFSGVLMLLQLSGRYTRFLNNDRLNGWMTDYHVKHHFCNPAHLQHFVPEGTKLLEDLELLKAQLQPALQIIFNEDTVEEWLHTHLDQKITKVEDILSTAKQQIKLAVKSSHSKDKKL